MAKNGERPRWNYNKSLKSLRGSIQRKSKGYGPGDPIDRGDMCERFTFKRAQFLNLMLLAMNEELVEIAEITPGGTLRFCVKGPSSSPEIAGPVIEKTFYEYHYTRDLKGTLVFIGAVLEYQCYESGLIKGTSTHTPAPGKEPRPYLIQGEETKHRLSYTAHLDRDPNDFYTTSFLNLFNNEVRVGHMAGIDYKQTPYISPVVLTVEPRVESEVADLVQEADFWLYGYTSDKLDPFPSKST